MQQNIPEQQYYQEDEIDLKQLFRSLADRKWFIFGFTGFITVLAVAYALSIPPTYKASISFLSPSESSVIQLNKIKLTSETSETSETIYRSFLNKVMSSQFQRKIFDENDYLAKLNPENKPIKNLEDFFASFSKSITLETEKEKKGEKANYEKPISVSLEGNDAQVISSFLNELASAADKETVNEFLNIIRQKINIRLDEISKQRGLLLSRAKQDRLAKIERIKIEDRQKINEINDQITRLRIKAKKDRLNDIEKIEKSNNVKIEKIDEKIKRLRLKTKNNRLNLIAMKEDENALKIKKINEKINLLRTKAKKDRLNKIQILSDAASIAAELGIIENNFKKISNNKFNNSDLTIAIGDNQKLPQWYLYGEKALLKEMQTLENRKNDDPYIPEIVNLQNQINTIKNDKDLLALKNRENDDPYISDIVTLKN